MRTRARSWQSDPFGRHCGLRLRCPAPSTTSRGSAHDGIVDALTSSAIRCWADKGYQGARGTIRVPHRGRWNELFAGQRAVNVSRAWIRAVGEQAIATLKQWRLPRKLRCSTTRITDVVKAVLALHLATSA
jgi:hypothetical protein